MAQRRMFSLKVIDTDNFLDMSQTAQLLYFHLSMRADDDGFVANPKRVMRMANISDDDLKILIVKKYIIPFESGICVIKDWKIHNYIQSDRYQETHYLDEKSQLLEDDNGCYLLEDTKCIQNVSKMDTQVRLGKVRLGKDRDSKAQKFKKPTLIEVQEYCQERQNTIDPQRFIDYYSSNGWRVGRNPMKDWKSAIRNWERTQKKEPTFKNKNSNLVDKLTKKINEQQI